MNGTEQRRQATVAQKLDQTAENLAVLFDALDARVFDLATKAQETRREVNELRAAHALSSRDLHDRLSVQHANLGAIASDHAAQMKNLRTEIDLANSRVWALEARSTALILDFHGRTFWSRLTWLFTGR